ncbi:hypothetical protein ACJX0J_017821, partial [Zea mays]
LYMLSMGMFGTGAKKMESLNKGLFPPENQIGLISNFYVLNLIQNRVHRHRYRWNEMLGGLKAIVWFCGLFWLAGANKAGLELILVHYILVVFVTHNFLVITIKLIELLLLLWLIIFL